MVQALIVEPTSLYQQILLDQCELAGIQAVLTKTAEEALSLLAAKNVDLIFCSSQLSGMGSFDFCEQLRESSKTESLPIVLITAATEK